MLSLTTNGHLRRISLDELGIYYVSDISINHAYYDAVNYQIRNRSSLGHFGYEVSFISSTSPGIQPYPEGVFTYTWRERERERERENMFTSADLECLVGKSRTIRLINSTEHSMYIVWHVSPSNNIECLHVSRPKLTYQVTISAKIAKIQVTCSSINIVSAL